jgi:uncharacterized protein (TIGR03083 family)
VILEGQPGGCHPIQGAHLLRKVDGELMPLLASLSETEWDVQTIAPLWRVRDVAAHLLDTVLRKLSLVRDSWRVEKTNLQTPGDVLEFVNRLNNQGVIVFRRLSPALLIEMMQMACEQSAQFHESLDPFAEAAFNVSWAGEEKSLNWFDTARELTERWHHQQQIRLATNRLGIMTRELYYPVLDCFLRGLPYQYRGVAAPRGTNILIEVAGDCGGTWVLSNGVAGWRFISEFPETIDCKVTIPQAIAWRIFTKGIDRNEARALCTIEGNGELAESLFGLTAIVG